MDNASTRLLHCNAAAVLALAPSAARATCVLPGRPSQDRSPGATLPPPALPVLHQPQSLGARKSLRCSGAGGGRSHAIVAVYVLDVSDGNAAPAAGSTVSICWGVSLCIGVFLSAGRRVSVADGYRPPERRYPARRWDTRPSHLSSMCAHDEHRAHAEAFLPPVHHAMVAVIMP